MQTRLDVGVHAACLPVAARTQELCAPGHAELPDNVMNCSGVFRARGDVSAVRESFAQVSGTFTKEFRASRDCCSGYLYCPMYVYNVFIRFYLTVELSSMYGLR